VVWDFGVLERRKILCVGGNILVDSETFVVTSSISRFTRSLFRHNLSNVLIEVRYVCVHRVEYIYVFVSHMHLYCVSLKKKSLTALIISLAALNMVCMHNLQLAAFADMMLISYRSWNICIPLD
jgi:uncharacterized membrane protein